MPKQTIKRKKRIVRHAPSPQHKKLTRIKKRSRVRRPVTQEEPVGAVKAAENQHLQTNISNQFAPSSEDVEADVVEVMEVEVTSGPEDQEEIDETETAADLLLLDED
jgi:hypothetical protein